MNRIEIIEQLESLKNHCKSMINDGEALWENDFKALETAIYTLRILNKRYEEDVCILCGNKVDYSDLIKPLE